MDIIEILGTIGDAYEKVYAMPNDKKLITLSVGS